MTLFLILFAPLTAISAFSLFRERFAADDVPPVGRERHRVFRTPGIVAALAFLPIYGLRLLAAPDLFHYSPGGLYLQALIREYLAWLVLQSIVSYLLVRRVRDLPEAHQYVVHLTVAGVMFFMLTVFDIVLADVHWTIEELFYRPLNRSMMLVLFPIALTVADNVRGGGWAVLALVVQPLLASVNFMLAEWIEPGGALAVLVATVGYTGFVVWFLLYRGSRSVDGGDGGDRVVMGGDPEATSAVIDPPADEVP